MTPSDVVPIALPAAIGVAGGLAGAWYAHWLGRNQAKLDLDKTTLEIQSLRENLSAGLKYQATRTDTSVIYDSTKGFSPFDLKLDLRDKAEGRVTLVDDVAKDAVLNLERTNTAGFVILKLDGRRMAPGIAGSRHRVRVELDARALGSAHTLLVTVKGDGSKPGEHIAEWRERLESGDWRSIDAYFDYSTNLSSYVRLIDRSVANAPSSLQVRNLVVTQKD